MSGMRREATLALAPWLFTVGFFLLWEVGCRLLGVSAFVLPAPPLQPTHPSARDWPNRVTQSNAHWSR